MSMKLEEWLASAKHLPEGLRDFHAQKDVFKLIHEKLNVEGHYLCKDVNWIAGQCYVIDIFLWFMARRGYTLQRTRKQGIEFNSLIEDVDKANKTRSMMFANALTARSGE